MKYRCPIKSELSTHINIRKYKDKIGIRMYYSSLWIRSQNKIQSKFRIIVIISVFLRCIIYNLRVIDLSGRLLLNLYAYVVTTN